MTRVVRRAPAAAIALCLLLVPLAACAGGDATSSPAEDEPTTSDEAESETDAGDEASSGEMFGCTEAILAYAGEYGYPEAQPLDPATLDIPLVSFDVTPDCYIVDPYSGAERYGAFWATDPQGVLSSLGAALDAAGYVQSDDFGPLVWWFNGDEPTSAEHAIAAAPQPVDGVEMLWATW